MKLFYGSENMPRQASWTRWWRHQMETFSTLLALCAGNSPVTGEFPAQRSVTRSFDVFFDLCLNTRLSKQSWGWWFEAPSRLLWRHSNENRYVTTILTKDIGVNVSQDPTKHCSYDEKATQITTTYIWLLMLAMALYLSDIFTTKVSC